MSRGVEAICAKGLIDENDHPSQKEIAYALWNNICRCTGYKKIIDAVELAAKIKREGIFCMAKQGCSRKRTIHMIV